MRMWAKLIKVLLIWIAIKFTIWVSILVEVLFDKNKQLVEFEQKGDE